MTRTSTDLLRPMRVELPGEPAGRDARGLPGALDAGGLYVEADRSAFPVALYPQPVIATDEIFSGFAVQKLTCGKFVQELAADPKARNVYQWWIAGFVIGANMVKGRVVTSDLPSHEVWLKNYCERNPLEPFMRGAIELDRALDQK